MYWFFTYEWRSNQCTTPTKVMDVFAGSFSDLVLFISSQPEGWIILFTKEISEKEYSLLHREIG